MYVTEVQLTDVVHLVAVGYIFNLNIYLFIYLFRWKIDFIFSHRLSVIISPIKIVVEDKKSTSPTLK